MTRAGITQHVQTGDAKSWVPVAGRIGFATKGVVYAIVAALAAEVAWRGGRAEGSEGAIATIGEQPFGQILLWMTAAGLAGYCVWRLVQAVTDPDRKGSDAKGIAFRLGFAASGIAHGFLAWVAISIATWGGGSGGDDSKRDAVAMVLGLPGGQWIVGIGGLIVLGVAGAQVWSAYTARFMQDYKTSEMSPGEEKTARIGGRLGLTARGVTFAIIGVSIIVAAINWNPDEIKGLAEALGTVASQSYGPWLLLAVAIGLLGYAVHCVLESRYRHFRMAG